MPDAVGAALHSVAMLARRGPATLLPSHGDPIAEADARWASWTGNLRRLAGLLAEIRRNRLWTTWPTTVDQPLTQVLPHLWANTHSVANTYALVDDDGDGLILDYGFPSWDHFFADQRFVDHTLDDFRAEAGLLRVRATVPSHYHDDHLAGVPWLQREHGAEAWIHDLFADIVAEPAGYDLPCLLAEPIRVDRILADGDPVEHAGAALETFHMPGPHDVRAGTRRGPRWRAGRVHRRQPAGRRPEPAARRRPDLPERAAPRVDPPASSADRPRARAPADRAHRRTRGEPRAELDDFVAWARELELVVGRLAPSPAWRTKRSTRMSPDSIPYRATVVAGSSHATAVIVTNHADRPRPAVVRLRVPTGWGVAPLAR